MPMNLGLGLGLSRRAGTGEPAPGPINSVAPVVSGTPEIGEELTTTDGSWTGTGTITYAYQWLRDGSNISGAEANTYTLVSGDDLTTVSCRVTATDDDGSRSAVSNGLAVTYPEPVNTVAPAVTGTTAIGDTLTSDTGTWTGGGLSYSYQWQRDTVDIDGAEASTYELVLADDGASIRCVVTATNSGGAVSANSNAVTAGAVFDPADLFTPGVVGVWSSRVDVADLWQDTARTTPVTATGQSVASWRVNTSSGSIYMQQASGTSMPTYQVDGNGVPYLNFDGSNDNMLSSATFALSGSTESTMMVAVDTDGSFAENKGYVSLSSGVNSGANRVIGQTASGGMKVDIVGANTTAPSIPTVFAVLEGKFSGTTISAAVDGGSFTTATGSINTTNNLSLYLSRGAAAAYAGGKYYGFLHIVKTLTPTERANLVAWMTALGNP